MLTILGRKASREDNNGGKILLAAPDLFISRRQEDDEHQERSFSGVGVLDPRDSGHHLPLFLHALVLLPLRLVPWIHQIFLEKVDLMVLFS